MAKKDITVTVIAKNEAEIIKVCLESCANFEEVIVVDSGSTDNTQGISLILGANVIYQDWLGFGPQKQFAVSQASNNWILSIDADEYLSQDLVDEINTLSFKDEKVAYEINRRSFFLGKEVKFSGWSPDRVIRLFNKKHCQFTDDIVHEKVTGFTTTVKLNGLLYHTPFRTKEVIEEKIKLYGALGKKQRRKEKHQLISATWSFVRTFLFQLGFLDGKVGFQIALMNAKISWIKYS